VQDRWSQRDSRRQERQQDPVTPSAPCCPRRWILLRQPRRWILLRQPRRWILLRYVTATPQRPAHDPPFAGRPRSAIGVGSHLRVDFPNFLDHANPDRALEVEDVVEPPVEVVSQIRGFLP
jgi:hypothetical protein